MNKVGIFRNTFGLPSEAWISEQARSLARYEPLILTRTRCAPTSLPSVAVGDGIGGKWRERIFALTRAPRLFGEVSGVRLIHAHFGPDALVVLPLARHLRVPLVTTFHGFDASLRRTTLLRTGRPTYVRFALREGELARRGALFIAVSRYLRDLLVERGFPEHRIVVHYLGVDTSRFRPDPGSPRTARYVLSVAQHVECKGLGTLLRAFARVAAAHPAVELVQVGDGPERASLEALAANLGIAARVRFLGAVAHDRVRALMQGAELFVLASQRSSRGQSEALGIVLNEASACGVPIVATRNGGISEAVLDGDTGLLVRERDDRALAEAMNVLLADPQRAAAYGARGREVVLERFDLQRQTARLESLYDRVIDGRFDVVDP